MNKPKLNIAVTGLNAIDSPGPGVAVIRGLREAASFDVRIIGLAYESLEPGIYMHDLVNHTYMIPHPSNGTDALYARLEYIHNREKLDVIIPNFDAELYSFMKLELKLRALNIHMFLPTFEQFEERHKVNLSKFGDKYDILVPFGKAISSAHEIDTLFDKKVRNNENSVKSSVLEIFNSNAAEAVEMTANKRETIALTGKIATIVNGKNHDNQPDDEFDFPVMIKGKWYDAYVANNIEQAKAYFHKISAKWGLPVVIQKFVHGTEYNVIGLGDGNGNMMAAVPMRKQYITDKGKAWAGISINDTKLLALTEKFIRSTKWRGAFELELMKGHDNSYYLMEINPRIPAWVYLAVGVGQNIPEMLVNLALGKNVEPIGDYDVGKLFIRYSYELIVDRSEFENLSLKGEL